MKNYLNFLIFAIISSAFLGDTNIVSVKNNDNKTKTCPSTDIDFDGQDVKIDSIGLVSGCFHYVETTDGDRFAVRPDSLHLFKLALVNNLIVWVEQNPEEDYYNKHSK